MTSLEPPLATSLEPPLAVSSGPYHSMAIHDAILQPDINLGVVEKVIEGDPESLRAVNVVTGLTPLQAAARRSHSRLIRLLVARGADLEDRGQNGETPFLIACQSGSLYAVHALVECGCDVRVTDNSGRTAMHYAAQIGALHILHYLSVTRGLGFQCTDNNGNTPLHLAVTNRNTETVKYLLRHKRADPTAVNNRGTTPLHVAAKLGSPLLSWILVRDAGDSSLVGMKDKNGYTAAAHAGMGKTVRHKSLSSKLYAWSASPKLNLRLIPRIWWLVSALLPGTFLLLGMVLFAKIHHTIGLVLALFAVGGFFWSLSGHRLSHDCRWPSPALFGALISGIVHTAICYFVAVLHRIWPANVLAFTVVILNSVLLLYLLWKFTTTDPGLEKVGKIGVDGNPMTILDIARQGDQAFEGPVTYSFCANCEIVIPERTKHCKLCEGCYTGFDHHCMWLHRCVAYNNHRLFVLFCLSLALDHLLFVKESLSCFSTLADSINPITMARVAFESEQWVFFLMACNFFSGIFVALNVGHQLLNVSRRETTYFDATGKAAYRQKRQRPKATLMKRIRMVRMFFVNYSKWYNLNEGSGEQTKGRRRRTKHSHVV